MADVNVDSENSNPKELYAQGVRAYVLQDYDVAVTALSKASELLVNEHGDDMHESLGDVYLYYGRSLLGLSRDQNEPLGDAVPKSAEDDDGDEDEDEGVEVQEFETPSSSSGNGSQENVSESKEEPVSSEPGPSKPSDKTKNGDEEEDASDLQLAWEVLELAKKIFQKQDDKNRLAETLITLGEISLESENFDAAITDIKEGLEIQKSLFSKDSRTIAGTLYKLAMAYSTNSQIDEAIATFNSSLDYLNNRIKTLEEMKPVTDEHTEEIEEINGLIPEIKDRISDMEMYKDEAAKKVAETLSAEQPKSATESPTSAKPASDISHLVKRKRKGEDGDDAPAAKKPAV